jgi:hypothetical protein
MLWLPIRRGLLRWGLYSAGLQAQRLLLIDAGDGPVRQVIELVLRRRRKGLLPSFLLAVAT